MNERPTPPRATATWLDRATMLLLLGVVFIVFVSAMPIVGHGLGLRPARTAPAPLREAPGTDFGDPTIGFHGLGDPDEPEPEVLGFGRVLRDTPLSRLPEQGAQIKGSLVEGEHVLLMRKRGSWVEVVRPPHQNDDNVGWVPAATIDVL